MPLERVDFSNGRGQQLAGLLDLPAADSIAQARPVQIVEYVPPVVMTPVPVVADVTTKHAGPPKPEMERKQPEKSLMTP